MNCGDIKGQFSKKNYRKMTISWSFSFNSFVKFHGEKIWSHNITVLYANLCYNQVCYEKTALYSNILTPYYTDPISCTISFDYFLMKA